MEPIGNLRSPEFSSLCEYSNGHFIEHLNGIHIWTDGRVKPVNTWCGLWRPFIARPNHQHKIWLLGYSCCCSVIIFSETPTFHNTVITDSIVSFPVSMRYIETLVILKEQHNEQHHLNLVSIVRFADRGLQWISRNSMNAVNFLNLSKKSITIIIIKVFETTEQLGITWCNDITCFNHRQENVTQFLIFHFLLKWLKLNYRITIVVN